MAAHGSAGVNFFFAGARFFCLSAHHTYGHTHSSAHDNLAEQKAVVTSMRQLVVDMRDPADWDSEDMFSEWDGIGTVPGIAGSSRGCSRSRRRLKQHDDTEPSAKKTSSQYVFKGTPVPY